MNLVWIRFRLFSLFRSPWFVHQEQHGCPRIELGLPIKVSSRRSKNNIKIRQANLILIIKTQNHWKIASDSFLKMCVVVFDNVIVIGSVIVKLISSQHLRASSRNVWRSRAEMFDAELKCLKWEWENTWSAILDFLPPISPTKLTHSKNSPLPYPPTAEQ